MMMKSRRVASLSNAQTLSPHGHGWVEEDCQFRCLGTQLDCTHSADTETILPAARLTWGNQNTGVTSVHIKKTF